VESPVPRPKRKRDQQDELLAKQMAALEERRMELQVKLMQGTDECSRFGQTVADLLDVMFKVYGLIHENRL